MSWTTTIRTLEFTQGQTFEKGGWNASHEYKVGIIKVVLEELI